MAPSVSVRNPIRIYPDGLSWCAVWEEDIQQGLSGFGLTPEKALEQLLDQDELWENAPHGTWELVCPGCDNFAVHVMSYPFPHPFVECHKCGTKMPVSNKPTWFKA